MVRDKRRILYCGVAIAVAGLMLMAVTMFAGHGDVVHAQAATGPQLDANAGPGAFDVTLAASGSGFTPYSSYNFGVSFDPAVLAPPNGITNNAANGLTAPFCPFSSTSGGPGIVGGGCLSTGSPATSSFTGDLGTYTFSVAPGFTDPVCTTVHMMTFGPPDNGDGFSGTFTTDANANNEANTYGNQDVLISVNGGSCAGGGATPTNTALPTSTNTATATATTCVTNCPTAIVTSASVPTKTSTPAATSTSSAAPTTAPGQPTTAPGGAPGGTGNGPGTTPGGAPGGVIQGPNTGTGTGSGGGNAMLIMLLSGIAAVAAVSISAGIFTLARKRSGDA